MPPEKGSVMPKEKFTQDAVARFQPQEKEVTYWDLMLPGFGVRVSPKGRKTWIVVYRVKDGRQRMETLGTIATVPKVEAARNLARASMIKARAGTDPIDERREAAAADAAKPTVNYIADGYLARLMERRRASTVFHTRRIIDLRVRPKWGDRYASEITRAQVRAVVEEVMAKPLRKKVGRPTAEASTTLGIIERMFGYAVAEDLMTENPAKGIANPHILTARDRVLSDDEIKLFWSACEQLGWPYGPLFKLLLVTGQRRQEVASMRWSELDLDKRLWSLPKERTKNNKAHDIPLSDAAVEIVEGLCNLGPLVFPAPRSGHSVQHYSDARQRLDAIMGRECDPIPHWVLHDLRRTAATGLQRLGIRLEVTEACLNHVSGSRSGIVGVYQRHNWADEKRAALEAWGRFIEALVKPELARANVVDMRASAPAA
jgi:integrase